MYFSNKKKFVLLIVLDGWGIAPPGPGNAISLANPKNFNKMWHAYPHCQLRASGDAVGLPKFEVGNTETGHLNLGAGRIVYQDLARINMAVADGAFLENPEFLKAIAHVKENNSSLHLMGLLGAGGVHSNAEHLYSLLRLASEHSLKSVYIHIFTDGRDSPPTAGLSYLTRLQEVIEAEKVGEVASVMGRYWAMDRDQRWERTAKAYFALTKAEGVKAKSAEEAILNSYENAITDEFIEPTIIVDEENNPKGVIKDNDAVIFYNFRIDRPRQLARAFLIDDIRNINMVWDFDPYAVDYEKTHSPKAKISPVFERGEKLQNLLFVMMTQYSKDLVAAGAHTAFPPEPVKMPLARVLAMNNLKQLRASESEKERFVTYYFSGLNEKAEVGEDRLIVNSPSVATYDLKPEMSAYELTARLREKLMKDNKYSFAVVNFANVDMVGHTGSIQAAIEAVKAVDNCLGELYRFILSSGGTMLITADHGNAEQMINPASGEISTEHSDSPVPFIAVSNELVGSPQTLPSGVLGDVAPTALACLGIQPPSVMTGRNLLSRVVKRS